ncbi:hypothetical protein MTR_1g078280 [Medicago truncatula]|uniref:Uncharacterized protein n=1 Tax=Medicago truncatula TaxID=3880 RepID=A0A072VLT0_MEDTR|nr:hypothetical protein MTR_1g078280 [Medicago truncatula]
MATKAITGLRDEGTKAKRLIWKVTCEDIATRRGQAQPFGTTTASAHCTYLESTQFPPAFIHHHHLHALQILELESEKDRRGSIRTMVSFEISDHGE